MNVPFRLMSLIAFFSLSLGLFAQGLVSPPDEDQIPELFKNNKDLARIVKDLGIEPKVEFLTKNGNPFDSTYDVSCNAFTFGFVGTITETGLSYGTRFVVQGYIYPEGTFAENGANSGINADGTPEFPELLVGIWYCEATLLNPVRTESGIAASSKQTFNLDLANPGGNTFYTEGFERFDIGTPWFRPVTGGSGSLKSARGQQKQTTVGFNISGTENFTMAIETNRWPQFKH